MGRLVRRVRQPGVYFVTTHAMQRRTVFANHRCARVLLEQLLCCRERGFYKLHAFVIMPDHFHALLTPGAESTLEKVMMMIKGGSAHRLKDERIYGWPVWQSGYHDRWIRDADEYETRLGYIASNPVNAHLVAEAPDYPFSSASGKFLADPSISDSGGKT